MRLKVFGFLLCCYQLLMLICHVDNSKKLNSISKCGFDQQRVAAQNKTRFEQLQATRNDTGEILAFEVVPFEVLWGMVVNSLNP